MLNLKRGGGGIEGIGVCMYLHGFRLPSRDGLILNTRYLGRCNLASGNFTDIPAHSLKNGIRKKEERDVYLGSNSHTSAH